MGQGQRSRGSRSNKGSKQRQVGSRLHQVGSFSYNIVRTANTFFANLNHSRPPTTVHNLSNAILYFSLADLKDIGEIDVDRYQPDAGITHAKNMENNGKQCAQILNQDRSPKWLDLTKTR